MLCWLCPSSCKERSEVEHCGVELVEPILSLEAKSCFHTNFNFDHIPHQTKFKRNRERENKRTNKTLLRSHSWEVSWSPRVNTHWRGVYILSLEWQQQYLTSEAAKLAPYKCNVPSSFFCTDHLSVPAASIPHPPSMCRFVFSVTTNQYPTRRTCQISRPRVIMLKQGKKKKSLP